ncbi:MAG: Translation initiation factor IF-2 [Alphaproteobacteria bacterium ADurb.Bin438]|nr:MAG: Translation initiation factor IF-2 [Alphaproteobacteria bacterium ADurb.Bin438]
MQNIIAIIEQFKDFHFLRPYFLFGLIFPLIIFMFSNKITSKENDANAWQKICDKYLLPHLLSNASNKNKAISLKALAFGFIVMAISLSGPTYKKIPTPTMKNASNIMIISDMSYCMNANDFTPNRAVRFKLKLYDILDKIKNDNVGFMLFAKYPYIVSPLTKDVKIIKNYIDTIAPEIMPEMGNDPRYALNKTLSSFNQNNIKNGIILLTTCNPNIASIQTEAKEIKKQNHHLFILGTGSVDGAPIPYQGDFLKDKKNEVIISKINTKDYEKIAKIGGGDFALMSRDDSDVKKIVHEINKLSNKQTTNVEEIMLDTWQDLGAVIALFCVPFFAFFFKRGFLILLFLFLPFKANALSFEEAFLNQNQQAKRAFLNQDYKSAKEKFSDTFLKAISAYKDKDYTLASALFNEIKNENIDALYNLGNATAYLKKYEEAIKIYEEVLKLDPSYENAKFNIEYLKKLMQQNQQNKDNQDKDNQNNQDKSQNNNENNQDKNQDKSDQNQDQNGDKEQDNKQDKSQQNNGDDKDKNEPNNEPNNEQNNEPQNGDENKAQNDGKNDNKNQEQGDNETEQNGDKKNQNLSQNNGNEQQNNEDKNTQEKQDEKSNGNEQQNFELRPDENGEIEAYTLTPTDKEPDENDKILMRINDDSSNLLKNRLRKMYEKMYK